MAETTREYEVRIRLKITAPEEINNKSVLQLTLHERLPGMVERSMPVARVSDGEDYKIATCEVSELVVQSPA